MCNSIAVTFTPIVFHIRSRFHRSLWFFLVVSLGLLRPVQVTAQNTGIIEGTVTDSTGNKVIGANIVLDESRTGTLTNRDGQYRIEGISGGTHKITVRLIGYQSEERRVTIVPGQVTTSNFQLKEAILELGNVQVVSGPGPRSVWVGAQVAYNLSGGPFVDNFQASGRAVIEVLGKFTHRFGTFLIGNVSRLKTETEDKKEAEERKLQEIQQSTQGLHFSIVPHYFWGDRFKESCTAFISVGWKLNALKDKADELQYLHQGRFSVGVELTGLRGLYAELPSSLTVEPTLTVFSKSKYKKVFNDDRAHRFGIDLTLIVPAGLGRGILFETTLAEHMFPTYQVGLLLASSRPVKLPGEK
jgi:hypothetical protein